jgi:coenzyme F420-0:L-glutamate ligase / coenzyme F420-1:gamma-L-glutamate ligase
MVQPGDSLYETLRDACTASDVILADGDIVVFAQKIVSKAEGRQIRLADVTPSAKALELEAQSGKDARLIELILSEASEVMRVRKQLVIVRHKLGFVLANAGIDQSNVEHGEALLLPVAPDASAARLRAEIRDAHGRDVAVVIIDSFGRAWRKGTSGTAIGAAGLPTFVDLRGRPDLFGRSMETSEIGLADEVAAAASLLMGQTNEGTPIVILRGLNFADDGSTAQSLIRPLEEDLFQ